MVFALVEDTAMGNYEGSRLEKATSPVVSELTCSVRGRFVPFQIHIVVSFTFGHLLSPNSCGRSGLLPAGVVRCSFSF